MELKKHKWKGSSIAVMDLIISRFILFKDYVSYKVGPPNISWLITPINYSYIYLKP